MSKIEEINEIKKNIRELEDEINFIKREQIYIEQTAPFDIKKMLPVGLFLLFLGVSFAFAAYAGIVSGLSGVLTAFSFLLALIFIFAGAKLTKIGIKSNRVSRRTEKIIAKGERVKKLLEIQLSEKL